MPFIAIAGRQLEYRMIPGDPTRATRVPARGPGCTARPGAHPRLLPAGLATVRAHGRALTALQCTSLHFMHEEALDTLPALLERFHIERPLLVGQSDWASMALIRAATSDRPVEALALMPPLVCGSQNAVLEAMLALARPMRHATSPNFPSRPQPTLNSAERSGYASGGRCRCPDRTTPLRVCACT